MNDAIELSSIAEVVNLYRATVGEIAKWTKLKDELNARIKDAMGNATVGVVNGVPAVRKSTVRQNRFDARLFREDYPELHDKYTIRGTVERLTLVKADDGEAAPGA